MPISGVKRAVESAKSAMESFNNTKAEGNLDVDIDEVKSKVAKDYFGNEFDGCTLTKLSYPGDTYADEFDEWAEQYDADEAIVILSSFDVDSSGGDGSLNPDSTYDDWKWILIRNDSGNWEHVDHGY